MGADFIEPDLVSTKDHVPVARHENDITATTDVANQDLAKPTGMAEIASYASGIGPNKNLIVARDSSNHLQRPTSLIRDAHHVGLLVHPFTFRNENTFLPQDFRLGNPASREFLPARGDSPAEFRLFFGLGVDGLFTDDADTAAATRTEMFGAR